jgi:hypothetical protein
MSAGTGESDPSELVAELCRLREAGHLTDGEFALASHAITDPDGAPSDPDAATTAAPSWRAPHTTPGAPEPRRGALPVVGAALLAVAVAVSIAVISTSVSGSSRALGAAPNPSAPVTSSPSSLPSDVVTTAPITLAVPSPLSATPVIVPATPTASSATSPQPKPDPASRANPPTTDIITTPPAKTSTSRDLAVAAAGDWQDSGVTVSPGDQVEITRTGSTWSPFPGYSYDGRGCIDTAVCSQDPSQANNICCMAHGGLLGRIGSGAPFAVGNGTALIASAAGAVALRINDLQQGDDSGHLDVRVTRS